MGRTAGDKEDGERVGGAVGQRVGRTAGDHGEGGRVPWVGQLVAKGLQQHWHVRNLRPPVTMGRRVGQRVGRTAGDNGQEGTMGGTAAGEGEEGTMGGTAAGEGEEGGQLLGNRVGARKRGLVQRGHWYTQERGHWYSCWHTQQERGDWHKESLPHLVAPKSVVTFLTELRMS